MTSFAHDLRAAVRAMRGRPGLSLTMILTLALGIGAVTALFTVVDAVLLRKPPIAEPDRVVMVFQHDRITGTSREAASVPDYFDLRSRARGFAGLAAFAPRPVSLSGHG